MSELLRTALVSVALLGATSAGATPADAGRQRIWLEVGISDWPALGDVSPAAPDLPPSAFGPFDREGWSVGGGWLVRVRDGSKGALWLGGHAGFVRHANTVRFVSTLPDRTAPGELRLRTLIAGGAVEWTGRGKGAVRPVLAASLDWAQADAAAQLDEGRTLFDSENERTVSASAAFGVETRLSREAGRLALRALVRVRHLDFGSVGFAAPASAELDGITYGVTLGISWASKGKHE